MSFWEVLQWRRVRFCHKLFANPWKAWWKVTFCKKGEYSLTLSDGTVLHFPHARLGKRFWRFIFSHEETPLPMGQEGKLLFFQFQGFPLFLRPWEKNDIYLLQEIFADNTYQVSPKRSFHTVVDLGANIGFFSRFIAPRAKKVVALEAVRENFEVAQKNLSFFPHVRLYHLAIWKESGKELKMHLDRDNAGAHSFKVQWIQEEKAVEKVPTISLEELWEREKIEKCDLLKCDIEGAEYEVFLNTPPELLHKIKQMVMEWHFSPEIGEEKPKQLEEYLRQLGFHLTWVSPPPKDWSRSLDLALLRAEREKEK